MLLVLSALSFTDTASRSPSEPSHDCSPPIAAVSFLLHLTVEPFCQATARRPFKPEDCGFDSVGRIPLVFLEMPVRAVVEQ